MQAVLAVSSSLAASFYSWLPALLRDGMLWLRLFPIQRRRQEGSCQRPLDCILRSARPDSTCAGCLFLAGCWVYSWHPAVLEDGALWRCLRKLIQGHIYDGSQVSAEALITVWQLSASQKLWVWILFVPCMPSLCAALANTVRNSSAQTQAGVSTEHAWFPDSRAM